MNNASIHDEVAVLIPTLNSATYLAESIESIINQSWPNIKIYILDGGSLDCTLDIANSYARKYNNIEVSTQLNVHPCKRVDECIKRISSDYFAIQHSDDISYSNRIESQLKAFKKDPELGVCSASYRSFWHERRQLPTHSGDAVHAKPIKHEEIKCQLIFWWVMHAPTLMFDREKAIAAQVGFENEYLYINDYWQTVTNIDKLKYENINEELSAYRLHFSGDGAKNTNKILEEAIHLKEQVLKRFGFKFSKKELSTHLKIKILPDGKVECASREECEDVISWLLSLSDQNKETKIFDIVIFDDLLKGLLTQVENYKSTLAITQKSIISKVFKL